jgi:hypothetical protein
MSTMVKVLVSVPRQKVTALGLWRDDLDFNFTEDYEPLTPGSAYSKGEVWDDPCGCGRCYTGITSSKGATVFIVQEKQETELLKLIIESAFRKSWGIPVKKQLRMMKALAEGLEMHRIYQFVGQEELRGVDVADFPSVFGTPQEPDDPKKRR